MTVQEQTTASPADPDVTDTEVLDVAPSPVFVDTTGRRRRLLRRLAYGFIVVCMLYGGLICVSLAGGPVSSSAILPLPNLGGVGDDTPDAPPAPAPSASSPAARPAIEALPRRRSAIAKNSGTMPRPSAAPNLPVRTPVPAPSPSPRAGTTRPTESTTTPAPPATTPPGMPAPTSPTATPTTPASPPAPAPPPATGAEAASSGSGGSGGSAGTAGAAGSSPAPPSPAGASA